MTFSHNVKDELVRVNVRKNCCKTAEIVALAYTCGTLRISENKKTNLVLTTENASMARRIFAFVKDMFKLSVEMYIRKNYRLRKNNCYILTIPQFHENSNILNDLRIMHGAESTFKSFNPGIDKQIIRRKCCKKSHLRGAFLGSGSLSDPEKGYHLEIVTHNRQYAADLCTLLNEFNLHSKIVERKGNIVVYLKEGEHIVEFLSLIGAHNSVLNLENLRVYKDIRNNVNRLVNCETANLTKTVNAAIRQLENIRYIDNLIGIRQLPLLLREIAYVRLEHEDANYTELGEMLNPKVGKSGVNHRLRKLDQIAQELKEKNENETSTDN